MPKSSICSHDFFAWPPSAQPPVLPRDPERAQALGMARNVDHHEHPVAEHIVRPACGAHKAIPVEGLHLRAAPPVRIVADAVDGRAVLREAQFVLQNENFLRVRDQLEAVRVVTVKMREQHRVPIDRRDAPRRELLVDGRTAFDNNLIRKIQRQRAERADLRPALKDAVRAHIAVPAAVEQNVPVRALDEIGRNRQPEPF